MKTHEQEKNEEYTERQQVASVHRLDFSIIKGMGGILLAILGFLAVMVIIDHTTIASLAQSEIDHERYFTEMDADHLLIIQDHALLEAHWGMDNSMADDTPIK